MNKEPTDHADGLHESTETSYEDKHFGCSRMFPQPELFQIQVSRNGDVIPDAKVHPSNKGKP